ncbi:hypothetical protein KC640_02530 [Candidatus Dojkabacteria bacterium]|uniref:Uncharacterized protein n=1 Tax=Candidatus Dojkabacteria bacterium TaxID=2099670 RepID=A0A955L0K5_9BACT|nr:hypothetical protein [Candidatus Dojkabacteria bacterium]
MSDRLEAQKDLVEVLTRDVRRIGDYYLEGETKVELTVGAGIVIFGAYYPVTNTFVAGMMAGGTINYT